MTHKCSKKGNTLTSVHAEKKVMEGRNFLGLIVARKEWG